MIEISEAEYNQMQDQYIGLCIICKSEKDSCEPDARNYECDSCGRKTVFGMLELLVAGRLEIIDD